jgi:hypothetical protein
MYVFLITEPRQPRPRPESKTKKSYNSTNVAFLLYCDEVRGSVTAENPGCTPGQINKMLGDRWLYLPLDQKDQYRKEAEEADD